MKCQISKTAFVLKTPKSIQSSQRERYTDVGRKGLNTLLIAMARMRSAGQNTPYKIQNTKFKEQNTKDLNTLRALVQSTLQVKIYDTKYKITKYIS